jgi:transcriptional regulator with XRE-family HTH domain
MNFGVRLAEERKRLGLKQAEFARLVGTDVPRQSLYETGKRELRAPYLARLAEAHVDIVYVLTGQRAEGSWLGEDTSALVSAFVALPVEVRHSLLGLAEAMRDQMTRPGGTTLHTPKSAYRPEPG